MSLTVSVAEIVATDPDPLLRIHPTWERVELGEIAEVVNGFPFKSKRFNRDGEGMPLVRIRNVVDGSTETYTTEEYESRYRVRRGDLLVGMDGDFNSARWTGPDALLNQRVCKLIVDEDHYAPRFLDFALPGYLNAIHRHTSSVTVKHLSSKSIRQIPLPVPPLAEQRRIVDALEAHFADLDAGVEALTRARRDLDRYRRSVLKAAVEGALTADWRTRQPETEDASALLERILEERRERWEAEQLRKYEAKGKTPPKNWRQRYKPPAVPETDGLPELPEGWVWTSMDSVLVDIEAGKSFKCEERRPKGDEVGLVKVSAVSWGEYKEEESKTCLDPNRVNPDYFVRTGDFLFSRANTIDLVGACVIARNVTRDIMLSDKILRLRLVGVIPEWILFVLRSQHGRRQIESLATGNQDSMRNIGQRRIRDIAVPLPPLAEQVAIVSSVDEKLSVAETVADEIDRQLARAERLRRSLLKRAFEGRLVPQDPSDEPASALLTRIASGEETPGPPEFDDPDAVARQVEGKRVVQATFDF
ncbi:MAG TPA: restriction endonuclease subunit S [Bacteroidetes bacterium]|nr:restriction endonuclease subunit S [Bacteroidota bacterium]